MSRFGHVLRMTLALAVVMASLGVPAPLLAAEGPYEHVWQARTLFAGETGETRVEVLESSARMMLAEGRYRGTVTYADLLGIEQSSGTFVSQESRIEIELVGDPLEGGSAAGGTFVGRATLTVRDVASLDDAVSPAVRAASGTETVFEVRGHWGALVENGTLDGEVLYERARVLSGEGVAHEPAWFNRASLANPDGLGDAQRLAVSVSDGPTGDGPGGTPPGGDDESDGGPGTGGGGTGDDQSGTSTPGSAPTGSVLDHIARGLRGGPPPPAPVVPDAEAAAARRLLDARPVGARPLPPGAVAIDIHLAGAYLDAKNRAAGLGEDGGPGAAAMHDATAAAAAGLRRVAIERPAAPEPDSPGELHAARIREALAGADRDVGAADVLLGQLELLGPAPDREQVALLRTWAAVAEALSGAEPYGSVLAGAAETSALVASAEVPQEGPLADVVLAAADSYLAPSRVLVVPTFGRVPTLDVEPVRGAPTGASLPGRVLALHGSSSQPPALSWSSASGGRTVAPDAWLGYERVDDAVFWLAGEAGEFALTDASVRGWAFARGRAALVDASRCGRIVEFYRAE